MMKYLCLFVCFAIMKFSNFFQIWSSKGQFCSWNHEIESVSSTQMRQFNTPASSTHEKRQFNTRQFSKKKRQFKISKIAFVVNWRFFVLNWRISRVLLTGFGDTKGVVLVSTSCVRCTGSWVILAWGEGQLGEVPVVGGASWGKCHLEEVPVGGL